MEAECLSTPKVAWMEKEEMTKLQDMWEKACKTMLNSLRERDEHELSEHHNLINGLQIIIEAAKRDFDHFNYGKPRFFSRIIDE